MAELSYSRGEAYRLSGGADEILILLPGFHVGAALNLVRKLLATLGRAQVEGLSLRAAAGVVVATDPAERADALIDRGDLEQRRAKVASKANEDRPSVLAWGPDHLEVLPAASAP